MVSNLANGSSPFLLFGLSDSSWNGVGLPMDLGVFGLAGCELRTSPDYVFALANRDGTAEWSLPLPPDDSLYGFTFFNQAVVADATGLLAVTNVARGTVGR